MHNELEVLGARLHIVFMCFNAPNQAQTLNFVSEVYAAFSGFNWVLVESKYCLLLSSELCDIECPTALSVLVF